MTFYVFLSCCTRFPEQCPEVQVAKQATVLALQVQTFALDHSSRCFPAGWDLEETIHVSWKFDTNFIRFIIQFWDSRIHCFLLIILAVLINKYLNHKILFQILQFISVFKYYLKTQIMTLVFKYILRVYKYLTNAHNNNPVKNTHCH